MNQVDNDGAGRVLLEAEFDQRLKTYLLLMSSFYLLISIVGIPILVVWLLGPGQYWAARHYRSLRCALTEQSLVVERGVLFTVQKTIPLQRIQDLTVRGGPVLRAMGLEMMSVETAGQSNPQGGADARLIGVVDLRRFRQQVLEQCRVADSGGVAPPAAPAAAEGAAATPAGGEQALLEEIRDTLQRIKRRQRQAEATVEV